MVHPTLCMAGWRSLRAGLFAQRRVTASFCSGLCTMIPLPRLQQRAAHAQAGASSLAAEEGQDRAAAAFHSPIKSAQHPHPQPHLDPLHQPHGYIELICGPMFAGKSTELLRRAEQQARLGRSVAVVKSNKDNRYDLTHVVTHDGLKRPCYSVPSLAAFRLAAGADYHSIQVIAIDEAQFFTDLVEFCAFAADEDAKHVIVAGLDGDFQRRRFGQILDVVPFADSVTKLTARCTYCQQEAEAEAAGTGRRPLAPANHAHGAAPGGSAPSPAKHAHGHTAGASEGGQPHGAQHAQAAALHSGGQPGPRPALFSLRIAADSRQEVVGGADKYAPVCRHHYLRLSKVREEPADCKLDGGNGEAAAEGQA